MSLLVIISECQQHISEPGISCAVPRSYKYHSAGDRRACLSNVSAFSRHTIDTFEFSIGVVLPEDVAIGSRKCAKHAVCETGENGSGNGRGCCRITWPGCRSLYRPWPRAVGEFDSRDASAGLI